MKNVMNVVVGALVLAIGAVGCVGTGVGITGDEYEFTAPDRLQAGETKFEFQNIGKEEHELALARLNDGVSADDLLTTKDLTKLVTRLKQVAAEPGKSAKLNITLVPGTWVMACFVEAPDGKPHAVHGMVRMLRVSDAA